MEFWNSLLTEKSWNILQGLAAEPFQFVLIGGWAAWLWTGLHKSKDVDIVVAGFEGLEYLRRKYSLKKNDSLRKYEISFGEIDVDIYVPFFSRLALPAEDIASYSEKVKGINVASPEALLVLKQGAEIERRHSVKGKKDAVDIMALLLYSGIDFGKYNGILRKYGLEGYRAELKKVVNGFRDVQYLNLNPRQFRLRKEEILKKV